MHIEWLWRPGATVAMDNWRTVEIIGRIDPADAEAAGILVHVDPASIHPLAYVCDSLCGLGMWIPERGGDIHAFGDLAERDCTVGDVADALEEIAEVAPSLWLKVHCGGKWESRQCVATITVTDGKVTIGPPEINTIGTSA